MVGFNAYNTHIALNLHFDTNGGSYDYFKYNGKTRATKDSFKKNPFRWQYAALEQKAGSNLLYYYYLVFKHNDFKYVRASHGLFKLLKTFSSDYSLDPASHISEQILNDLSRLKSKYSDDYSEMVAVDDLYPSLYDDYQYDSLIDIETLLLFDSHITSILNPQSSNDVVTWPSILIKMEKVRPFVLQFTDRKHFMDAFNSILQDDK